MYLINFLSILLIAYSLVATTRSQEEEGSSSGSCTDQCSKFGSCTNVKKEDETPGYCCRCNEGYAGNGVHCYLKDDTLFIRGTYSANVNNIELKEQLVHGIYDTIGGQSSTGITVPSEYGDLGYTMQLVAPFVTSLAWLFAGNTDYQDLPLLNGFRLSGGVFKRTSDSTYYDKDNNQIGNIHIEQTFDGSYEGRVKEIKLTAKISGELPKVPSGYSVIYNDFRQDYTLLPNLDPSSEFNKKLTSSGMIKYKFLSFNDFNNEDTYSILNEEQITFSTCTSLDSSLNGNVSVYLKELKVEYNPSIGETRFGPENHLSVADDDPCDSNNCNQLSTCVVDRSMEEGYYCRCKSGFEETYSNECVDIDECITSSASCRGKSECVNTFGSFICKCSPPYIQYGYECKLPEKPTETDNYYRVCSNCDPNASCIQSIDSKYLCVCNQGYKGNGYQCEEDINVIGHQPNVEAGFQDPNYGVQHSDKCSQCHPSAICEVQRDGGECCRCLEGYVGNGKYCFASASQLSITGKVNGVINGQSLTDIELFGSILTLEQDPRNHVVLGNVPVNMASTAQLLLILVNPINWLFAGPQNSQVEDPTKPYKGVANGFTLTGGLFKRSANVTFYDERSNPSGVLHIEQEFFGLDQDADKNNKVNVKTEVRGTLPNIDADAKVHFRDFKQEYKHQKTGDVITSGELLYDVTYLENTRSYQSYRLKYGEHITYSECPHSHFYEEISTRVNTREIYVIHIKGDNLVRFSSINFIYAQDAEDDPCEVNDCSIYAECVPDEDSEQRYKCICRFGFDGDGVNCYDIDECLNGEAACDENAVCYNLLGHYECRCKSPFRGTGLQCDYDVKCQMCSIHADCVELDGKPKCICKNGYAGDGYECVPSPNAECGCHKNAECIRNYKGRQYECQCHDGWYGDGHNCKPLPCNEKFNCAENAYCEVNANGVFECKCGNGTYGDGYRCSTETCDRLVNCGDNARCVMDPATYVFQCQCLAGYTGNGYTCVRQFQNCAISKNCHPNADCAIDEYTKKHQCKCKPGYTGDGIHCTARNSCRDKANICDTNALCLFDPVYNDFICRCKPGLDGDGLYKGCYPIGEGPIGLSLIYAQGVSLHKIPFKRENDSVQPYKSRIVYIPYQTAVGVDYDCHEQYIYWTDVTARLINRVRPDGSSYSVVARDLQSPEGIAVDWLSRNLYFTDSKARTIELASLNGGYRKALIKTHLHNPRGIAIDPIDGYIFWTDWYRKAPKIERANMDGTDRVVLVSDGIGLPNGLYYDQRRREVCWGDAKTKRIECIGRDGRNRRNVTVDSQMYPFDITEVGTNVYWSDWSRKEIVGVDKDGNVHHSFKLAPGGNGRVYGIAVVKSSCPLGTNACAFKNGGCSHICVPREVGKAQCLCPDNVPSGECKDSYRNF